MDLSKQPGIVFESILLVEEEFWRDRVIPENLNVILSINIESGKMESRCSLLLECNLKLMSEETDAVEVCRLRARFMGYFIQTPGQENMEIDDFLKYNAPALMFPYVREHISTITQKAGLKPVYLPPMNWHAALLTSNQTATED